MLHLIHPPTQAAIPRVDIIAVHGLNLRRKSDYDHAFDTWRRPLDSPPHKLFRLWLKDDLPSVAQDARIFIYEYDSKAFRNSDRDTFIHKANQLLECISNKRANSSEYRPIIFLGHSMGGILIKLALINAYNNVNYISIQRATTAIAFFGTPHQGVDTKLFIVGHTLERIARGAGLQQGNTVLKALSRKSTISEFVNEYWRDQLSNYRILTFWGSDDMKVPKNAAEFSLERTREHVVMLEASHGGVCKFGDSLQDQKNLDTVLANIRAVYDLARFPVNQSCQPEFREVITSHERLDAQGTKLPVMDVRRKPCFAVPLEKVHTYTERGEISAQLEQKLLKRQNGASVAHAVALHGLGGVGKSQLAVNFAVKHKNRYDPILWIDATDEEAVRSSFRRCAAEIGLTAERIENQGSLSEDPHIQAVLRWLRVEACSKWLVIIDNADDVSWGVQQVVPKGEQGSVIITSQDQRSIKLVSGACEGLSVGVMSPVEARALVLRHLSIGSESASDDIHALCDQIAEKLGYLALAVDLAGAYIGNAHTPEHALLQYLSDYDKHRNELLHMNEFQGLLPTHKTVWTVWDTTLKKISEEYEHLQPGILLTFLAQFQGSIIQDENFRLGSLGRHPSDERAGFPVIVELPDDLQQFFQVDQAEWDSFQYRQARDVLIRYHLLQETEGQWPGVTMHNLVQWRARQSYPDRPWRMWYTKLMIAAYEQLFHEKRPDFQRYLMVHVSDIIEEEISRGSKTLAWLGLPNKLRLARLCHEEGRWADAEKLQNIVMRSYTAELGPNHPETLNSATALARTYCDMNRFDEAEKLQKHVLQSFIVDLGADHHHTMLARSYLAKVYTAQGRWNEARELQEQVMKHHTANLGVDHIHTLSSMGDLAHTYYSQSQLHEAQKLQQEVIKRLAANLGVDHIYTLLSKASLGRIYNALGWLDEAEELNKYVAEKFATIFGPDNLHTLESNSSLAKSYAARGKLEVALKLQEQVLLSLKAKPVAYDRFILTTTYDLARTYWDRGERKKAEDLRRQLLDKTTIRLGANHPDTLEVSFDLAQCYMYRNQWEDALKLQQPGLERYKAVFGAEHVGTLTCMHNLAWTFSSLGRRNEAVALMTSCVTLRRSVLGQEHPLTKLSQSALSEWKCADG